MFSTFLKSLNVLGLSVPLFFITSSLLAFLLVICAAQESFCIPFLLPLLPAFLSCLPTSLPSCSCSLSCSPFLTYIKIEKCLWVIVRVLGVGFFFCIYEIRYCFNIYRFRTLQFYTRVFGLYKSRSKQKQISNPNKLRHSIVPVLRILHFSQFNCYFFL